MPFQGIALILNGSRTGGLVDPVTLGALFGGSRIRDPVACNHNITGMRLDIESVAALLIPIVEDLVIPERGAMSAVLERLLPEIDTRDAIAGNGVVKERIVGVLVSDGDPILPVVFNYIARKLTVPYPPAQEQAYLSVVVNAAVLHCGLVASGTGMDSIACMSEGFAIQHANIVRDLKRNTVSVVVPGNAVADSDVAGQIDVNCAASAAVDVRVLILVPIDGHVFKDHAFGLDRAENWKSVSHPGVPPFGIVVPQGHGMDAKNVAFHGGNRSGADVPSGIEVVIYDAQPHPGMKFLWVGHSQLAFSVISVLNQRALDPGTLKQNRLAWGPSNRHRGWDEKAVVHLVSTGADLQGVAGSQQVRCLL